MKKLYRLLIVVCFLPGYLFAQDWQCYHDTIVANYLDTAGMYRTICFDSTEIIDGKQYCWNYNSLNKTGSGDCYKIGPSWMGKYMITDNSGNTYFFNEQNDSIRFRTGAGVNEPWIFARFNSVSYIEAKVSALEIDTILGLPDSTKTIVFQARLNNGDTITSPINLLQLKLSKHYGFINTLDFYNFIPSTFTLPNIHVLAGLSDPLTGSQNLTRKEVFTYSPGDILHTKSYSETDEPFYAYSYKYTINKILEATWSNQADTVEYKIARYTRNFSYHYEYEVWYSRDTVNYKYYFNEQSDGINSYPNLVIPSCEHTMVQSSTDYCNHRRVKSSNTWYWSDENCIMPYWYGNSSKSTYIDGCGSYSENHYSDFGYSSGMSKTNLLYYKKGSEEWGTPIDTSYWNDPLYADRDWDCIYKDRIVYYSNDTANIAPSDKIWAVKVESVYKKDYYHYYYSFHDIRSQDSCEVAGGIPLYNTKGASLIGNAYSAGSSGNYFHNSTGHGIRFCTDWPVNQSWKCCYLSDTSHIEAVVTKIVRENILGIHDDVKYISFQAKTNSGVPFYHPLNDQVFKVSKKLGMLTMFDFYNFPDYSNSRPVHYLSGILAPPSPYGSSVYGFQNLTYSEIYDFNIGDEFHTYLKYPYTDQKPAQETKAINVVKSKTLSSNYDSITYRITRITDNWDGNPDHAHTYTNCDVTSQYPLASPANIGLDCLPRQAFYCEDSLSTGYYGLYNQLEYDGFYNSRRCKELDSRYAINPSCSDSLVECILPDGKFYFIDGCGGEYYSRDWYEDNENWHASYDLVFFRKGDETWGTPFDTTDWEMPFGIQENNLNTLIFSIYPNPTNGNAMFSLAGNIKGDLRLDVFTISGRLVEVFDLNQAEQPLSLENYRAGMYYAKLYQNGKLIGCQKIVKY
jgi:hypothetical protein